jgi:hypothetical protein
MSFPESVARTFRPSVRLFRVLCASTFILASCGQATPDRVTLEWQFEPGAELVYQVTTRTRSEAPRGQGSSENTMTQIRRVLVQSVDPNGDATVKLRTGDDPTTDQEMVVGRDGRVKSLEGLEQLASRSRADPPPEFAEFAAIMARMVSEEGLTAVAQQNFPTLPSGAIARADTWQDSLVIQLTTGPVTTNFRLNLEALERRDGHTVAIISGTGDVPPESALGMSEVFGALADASSGPSDTTRANPFAAMAEVARMMNLDIETVAATLTFDVDRGITLASATIVRVTMSIPRAGEEPMPMTIEHELELVEYDPGG